MANAYVRMSVVKKHTKFRNKDMRVGKDAIDMLDKKIEYLIDEAVARAVKESRKTLKERDFE